MKTSIISQHEEHVKWLNDLAFYKDEIKVMQKRIEEIISKNTGKEVAVQIEHFQNQLFIQDDNMSKLIHRINHDENSIQNNIKQNPVASDHRHTEDHAEERELVENFEKHFKTLKAELNIFLSKWM